MLVKVIVMFAFLFFLKHSLFLFMLISLQKDFFSNQKNKKTNQKKESRYKNSLPRTSGRSFCSNAREINFLSFRGKLDPFHEC